MEVEHFEDKSHNPDKVVLWENLLPSCKKCNGSKSTHDVLSEPIVNPYVDEPKEHLALRLYRLRGKTPIGKRTIDITNLNDTERLVYPRFVIGQRICELIETSNERLKTYKQKKDIRSRNRLISIIENLLKECQPTAEYSACTATFLLTDTDFQNLIQEMKFESIWNTDLEENFEFANSIVLDQV